MNLEQFEVFCEKKGWNLITEVLFGKPYLHAYKQEDTEFDVRRELEVGMDFTEFKSAIEDFNERYAMMLFY